MNNNTTRWVVEAVVIAAFVFGVAGIVAGVNLSLRALVRWVRR